MSIVTESNVPNLVLQLNAVQRQVNYRGINREISDSYWNDEILPRLYPNWDTDRDRLIQFNYYDNNSFLARRRKYIKNFSTNQYEWKDYEMEVYEREEAKEIFESLKEAFYLIESVEKENFQRELMESRRDLEEVTWFGVRLVRNFLLDDSDWVFIEDSPVSGEDKSLWKLYRQKLRDIPQIDEYVEPIDVRFPISPFDWKTFYQPENPDEEYLGSQGQFLKLSGYFISYYKERAVQYLLVKQQVASPLNYKNYRDHMSDLAVFKAPAEAEILDNEELKKMLSYLPDVPSDDENQNSENLVDALLTVLSEGESQ